MQKTIAKEEQVKKEKLLVEIITGERITNEYHLNSLKIISHTHTDIKHNEFSNTYNFKVLGKARNITGKNIHYAEVTVATYNEKGDILGRSERSIWDIPADETWRFNVDVNEEEPIAGYTVKIKEIRMK